MYGSTVMCCESVCFVRFNYIVYFMPFTVLVVILILLVLNQQR